MQAVFRLEVLGDRSIIFRTPDDWELLGPFNEIISLVSYLQQPFSRFLERSALPHPHFEVFQHVSDQVGMQRGTAIVTSLQSCKGRNTSISGQRRRQISTNLSKASESRTASVNIRTSCDQSSKEHRRNHRDQTKVRFDNGARHSPSFNTGSIINAP